MHKLRHTANAIGLMILVIGIVGIGVGFFMGSSPVAIQNHGNLTEYIRRLQINWDVLLGYLRQLAAFFGIPV